jgi:DNA helicase HerA-like ATPase
VYDSELRVNEAILLRVLGPTALPTDSDVIASMVDYYKEDVTSGKGTGKKLDSFTRYEYQFSGLACRVLGTFYRDMSAGESRFGADIDNFYSPHNYSAYKPGGKVLEYIVNFRQGVGIPGGVGDVRIGEVRYASSLRNKPLEAVPVYVSALDFLGKRTALFGMTRTGKSNTVKRLIQATMEISKSGAEVDGEKVTPPGQIIFDVNGEYANANQQDEGTAIFEMFPKEVIRYSTIEKPGFKVMKLNFFIDVVPGFEMVRSQLAQDGADYVRSFLAIELEKPEEGDESAKVRWERKVAAYQCCLHAAGFPSKDVKVKFSGNKDLNKIAGGIDPSKGISLSEGVSWFTAVWEAYPTSPFFSTYRQSKGHDWVDEDLQALLRFLTRKSAGGGSGTISGYRKLRPLIQMHTATVGMTFEEEIVKRLRHGEIVIVDLSQGDPGIQKTYSERICRRIFGACMESFVQNEETNYIQMYFEEAHNLFPKREDSDLSLIYNRLAKEGAKLRIGLNYATQEVSSISGNILKNTQNWFVSHLNNQDELREIQKFYDFEDFIDGLRRATDRGFIRMKTFSNAFIVPVQIDRFSATS